LSHIIGIQHPPLLAHQICIQFIKKENQTDLQCCSLSFLVLPPICPYHALYISVEKPSRLFVNGHILIFFVPRIIFRLLQGPGDTNVTLSNDCELTRKSHLSEYVLKRVFLTLRAYFARSGSTDKVPAVAILSRLCCSFIRRATMFLS
jgi:hypothetical protein